MIPIVAFSVVALAVFLERTWVLRKERVVPTDFVQLIQRKIGAAKIGDQGRREVRRYFRL